MGKTVETAKKFDHDGDKSVIPNEYARGLIIEHAPSAQALKLMNLMIGEAGGSMAEDRWHKITLGQIRKIDGMRKHSRESLVPLFTELRAMTYVFDDTEKGQVEIGGFLDHAQIKYRKGETGDLEIHWNFSTFFKRMAAASNHWTIIERQTQFALRSKYSLLLFQHLSTYFNYKHVYFKRFTIPELRAVLNVENGKHEQFKFLNRDILKPAIAEINQLSRFEITMTTIKESRYVVGVEFSWEEKQDLTPTKRELDSPKTGRKARRNGTAERPVFENPFPAFGGFSDDGYWVSVLRQYWKDWTPRGNNSSTSNMADHIRKLAKEQGIELDDPKIQKLAANVFKNWKR